MQNSTKKRLDVMPFKVMSLAYWRALGKRGALAPSIVAGLGVTIYVLVIGFLAGFAANDSIFGQAMVGIFFLSLLAEALLELVYALLYKSYLPRYLAYFTRFCVRVAGFLLSARQLYFEQTGLQLLGCPQFTDSFIRSVFNYFVKGMPACEKTALIGPFTLAGWACVAFAVLSVINLRRYLETR